MAHWSPLFCRKVLCRHGQIIDSPILEDAGEGIERLADAGVGRGHEVTCQASQAGTAGVFLQEKFCLLEIYCNPLKGTELGSVGSSKHHKINSQNNSTCMLFSWAVKHFL